MTLCAACDEPLNANESNVRYNGRDYHSECICTQPIVTPRTRHTHGDSWRRLEHTHAGGREPHNHTSA